MFSHWRDRRGSCSPCLASLSSVFFLLLLLLLLPGNWFLALAIGIRDKIKINTHFAQLLEFQIPLLPEPLPQPLPPPLPLPLCLSCYRYCGELAIKMSGQFNTNKLSDSVCESVLQFPTGVCVCVCGTGPASTPKTDGGDKNDT